LLFFGDVELVVLILD